MEDVLWLGVFSESDDSDDYVVCSDYVDDYSRSHLGFMRKITTALGSTSSKRITSDNLAHLEWYYTQYISTKCVDSYLDIIFRFIEVTGISEDDFCTFVLWAVELDYSIRNFRVPVKPLLVRDYMTYSKMNMIFDDSIRKYFDILYSTFLGDSISKRCEFFGIIDSSCSCSDVEYKISSMGISFSSNLVSTSGLGLWYMKLLSSIVLFYKTSPYWVSTDIHEVLELEGRRKLSRIKKSLGNIYNKYNIIIGLFKDYFSSNIGDEWYDIEYILRYIGKRNNTNLLENHNISIALMEWLMKNVSSKEIGVNVLFNIKENR